MQKKNLKKLKLDSFLAIPVLRDDSHSFTVKDIIKVCANVKGGIHFGDPESESEITITDIDQKFSPHFIETSVVLISDIAWSYLKGVKPLVNTILEKYQSN